MQNGDLVSIEFTGKELSTGKVFDTTDKAIAEKEGLQSKNRKFGPVTVIVGRHEILAGLEDQLLTMKVGDQKTLTLGPEKAFGPRRTDLIRVIPLAEFKKNNVNPVPGTIVNANDMLGKVQSVSGGRVRVDFNGDLAGKDVEYTLKLVKHFTDEKEQLDALVHKAFPAWEKPQVTHDKDIVNVRVPIKQMTQIQRNVPGFSKLVLETLKSVKQVHVTTVFLAEDFKNTHVHEDGTLHGDDEH